MWEVLHSLENTLTARPRRNSRGFANRETLSTMNPTAHHRLVQENAAKLTKPYRDAKPGQVGLLMRKALAKGDSLTIAEVTIIFCSPEELADVLAGNAADPGAQGVIDDLRSGRGFIPGMVPIVVVSDSSVSLSMFPPSTFDA